MQQPQPFVGTPAQLRRLLDKAPRPSVLAEQLDSYTEAATLQDMPCVPRESVSAERPKSDDDRAQIAAALARVAVARNVGSNRRRPVPVEEDRSAAAQADDAAHPQYSGFVVEVAPGSDASQAKRNEPAMRDDSTSLPQRLLMLTTATLVATAAMFIAVQFAAVDAQSSSVIESQQTPTELSIPVRTRLDADSFPN